MGLLDNLSADQTQALGLLGIGLMNRNFGGGAQAAMGLLAGAKDRDLKQNLLQAQIAETLAQGKEREGKLAAMQRQQDLIGGLFGASGLAAPQVSPGAFQPSPSAAGPMGPTMPPEMRGASLPGSRMASLGFDQLAALKLNGLDLTELHKYANDPLKLEQGSTYQSRITGQRETMPKIGEGIAADPSGFYAPLPGYAASMAQIEGAKAQATERAKAGNTPLPLDFVDPATRRPVGGSVGDYLNRQPMQNQGGGTISPELAQFIRQDAERNGIANPVASFRGGGQGAKYGLAAAQPGPSGQLQSKAEAAAAQAQATLPVEVEKVYAEQAAKDVAEQRKQIMAAGASAPTNIATYQRIGQLLQEVDGGRLTPTGMQIASAANSLGLKIDKNLPNKEAATAMANEAALQLRNPASGAGMPGALSDADRNFLAGMTPNVAQTTEGRRQVIDAYVSVQTRNQQVATFARNYERKHGRLDNGFFDQLQEWSNANPLFKVK